jgi:hypothetical protein
MKKTMRRLLVLTLLIAYMASVVGFSFSFHYCGKHFRYITFSHDTEKGCCGKNERKSKCCSDKIVKAKIKDDCTQPAKAVFGKIMLHGVIHFRPRPQQKICYDVRHYFVANDSSPPFDRSTPIYLANRVIRI